MTKLIRRRRQRRRLFQFVAIGFDECRWKNWVLLINYMANLVRNKMQGSRVNLSPRELKIYSNFLFLWADKIKTDYGAATSNIENSPHSTVSNKSREIKPKITQSKKPFLPKKIQRISEGSNSSNSSRNTSFSFLRTTSVPVLQISVS